jgi:protein-L-isoaspartate(D-aspartate) O-methyltransferase
MVLQMLELLDLAPGHAVFEVGTGSGWNAALLGHLVAPGGQVETVEIIPDLVTRARRAIAAAGVSNVRVVEGDGGGGPTSDRPLDRAVYTAGAYDIPPALHDRVRVGGLLLFVLKIPGGGDVLACLRRATDHFDSVALRPCEFVPLTGATRDRSYDAEPLADFPPWTEVRSRVLRRRPLFALNDRVRGFALRSFLGVVRPTLRWFRDAEGHTTFGVWDEATRSLAIAEGDAIVSYGGPEAGASLERDLERWFALGMPGVTDLHLRAYPRAAAPAPRADCWSVQRKDTVFVWSTPRRT